MIRRCRLGDGAELDAGICRQVGAQLTTLALVDPAIIAPERRVTVAVSGGLEGQDGDRRLLAVAVRQDQVLDRGLVGTVWARGDETTGANLRWGHGVVLGPAGYAISQHVSLR